LIPRFSGFLQKSSKTNGLEVSDETLIRKLVIVCISLLLAGVSIVAYAREGFRKASVSGQFYPSDSRKLRKEIQKFLSQAHSRPDTEVTAIIVPHAGYSYSGPVAAEAYKTVKGRNFESVVIVAFLHQVFLPGVLVDDVDFYETPLGRVPVDRELVKKIRAFHPALDTAPPGDLQEHSLEVQLPFLQEVIPDLKIVPVYIGEQSKDNIEALAGALGKHLKGKNALVVFSTDLSHFHPYDEAVSMDQKVIKMIEQSDVTELVRANQTGTVEACGLGPICASLFLARKMGWSGPSLLRYANSGDVTGDHRSVVGYAAMVFTRSQELNEKDQKAILEYAHAVLKSKIQKKPDPRLSVDSPVLDEKRGVFVTLKENGRLRGCIGQILGQKPLRESIREMTLAAAFEDPRFPPVGSGELGDIRIHISFLTKPAPVKNYEDIRIGMDGIIVSHGWKKGVYLPEVATETGWDAKAFFTNCALEKAGIGQQDLDKTTIETFQTKGFED